MLRTKLEVLLDKMHLVLDESDGELDAVDKRLLLKYNEQIGALLAKDKSTGSEPISTNSVGKESIKPKPKPVREEKVAPQTEEKPEENESAIDHGKSAAEEEVPKNEQTERKPWVKPVDETEKSTDSGSLSFLDDATDEKETKKVEEETTEDDKYAEISKNLEAVRKQRAASQKLLEQSNEEEADEEEDEDDSSLNDRFRQNEEDLVDHLKEKPIKSLQTEIDLNDKFWFINELFEGDASTFNGLLRELDLLHSFEDAREKIDEMGKKKYNWDEDHRAVDKFYRVVRRRYL